MTQARLRNVKSLSLYVEIGNKRAQDTYAKLGMHVTGEKFYAYDFVYGNANVSKNINV